MATRSPGIYYNEIDNTQFENPKSVSGTTLAVVGYAKKGPIGEPTKIISWKDFVDIFGEAINGYYSGFAVKNFLSAGGTVLFTRVADENMLSESSYVIKNGKPAEDGYAYFEKVGDILKGDEKYVQEAIYNFKATVDDKTKYFLVRSPKKELRLTLADVVRQINSQLGETPSTFETKLGEFQTNFYGFNIELNGEKISVGQDFYIETSNTDTKENFVENLKNTLKQANAITTMEVIGGITEGSAIEDHDYTEQLKGVRDFTVIYNNQDAKNISIDFNNKSNIKITTIAEELDKKLKEIFNIRVFAVVGNAEKDENDKLVFVDLNSTANASIKIASKGTEEGTAAIDDLFASQQDDSDPHPNFPKAKEGEDKHVYVLSYNFKTSEIISNDKIEVSFDDVTKDLIIQNKNLGSTSTINFVDSVFSETNKKLSLFNSESTYHLFEGRFSIDGQDAIDLNVKKDLEKNQIVFTNKDYMPVLAKIVEEDTYFDKEAKYGIKDFIEVVGIGESGESKPAVSPDTRDKIIFTSKEKGSGTNNIRIDLYTTVNPIDPEDVNRTIQIFANGVLKETFSNISLKTDDPNRFDKIISAPVDNGGSAYVKADVVKEQNTGLEAKEVEFHDGSWYIGKANKEDDRKKPENVPSFEYDAYEYIEGSDGVSTEEGYLLFEEMMDPVESKLANKDLYDFHIIIAPDEYKSQEVQNACIKLCETRGDAITIVDPPVGLSKKDVIDWHNGKKGGRTTALDSNYAVTYWPWCKVYDTLSGKGKFSWIMPSIIMAAQYAKVDKTVGSQMAPAGELNGSLPVIDIEEAPSPNDRDELYTNYNRINPICKFKDGSIIAYGEKTTQRKDSVLTKIHTRRMLVQIKKQCREALRGYIFMPNTTDYLGKISSNVTAILESYKSNGGLNFYKVICDETNNPTEVRQQDMINVDVVLVPQGTIEQINISLTLNKSAETVTD